MWPWQEDPMPGRALPRLHHWLLAIVLLAGAMLAVPLFAALI